MRKINVFTLVMCMAVVLMSCNNTIIQDKNNKQGEIPSPTNLQNENYSFMSISPNKKVRLEFTEGEDVLKLVDVENNAILFSNNYTPDTRFTTIWSEDNYYVAVGYKNQKESRTFILIAQIGVPTTGKEIFSGELSQFTSSLHPENADAHILPIEFIGNSTLLLSIDWIDAEGNNNAGTTEWDFEHGTYTELKKGNK